MELSVSRQPSFTRTTKVITLVFILWIIPALMLLNLSRAFNQSLEQIEELGIRATELRQSLYFSEPLRVSRVNDLALDAQLVYSLRLQIESDFNNAWIRPDVNQLLYVVDQFLEKFDEFIPIESQVQYLVDDIKALRADPNTSEQLQPLLNQFGTVVFQAMYSENHTSSSIYRAFDAILEQSYQLNGDEQDALQQLLADASSLLGNYAQLNYLVDRIKKNSVSEQIIDLEDQYHSAQFYIVFTLMLLSGLALCAVAFVKIRPSEESGELISSSSETTKPEHTETSKSDTTPSNDTQSFDFMVKANHEPQDSSFGHVSATSQSNTPNPTPSLAKQEQVTSPEATSITQHATSATDTVAIEPLVEEAQVSDSLNNAKADNVVPLQPKEESLKVDEPATESVINIEEMLETLDGDHESVVLLLNVFVEDHANDFNKFIELKGEDEVTAARVVHSLKGVAGSIKASRLAVIASSVEASMKQSQSISEDELEELKLAIEATVNAAQAHLLKHSN